MATATHSPHPATTASSATLRRLLDEELVFSPSFRGYFSNHLAMALVALEQLGAPPDLLESTLAAYARGEHEDRDDRPVLDARIAEVHRDGIEATVRRRAARLVDGPSTALFHPMIRLAYALDVGHHGQVAAALLDWERRHDVLPVPAPEYGERDLTEIAARLAAYPSGTWPETFDLDGISQRAELHDALGRAVRDEHTVDDVSTFAIAAHIAADDFVTLHLVTGARAVRAIADLLDAEDVRRLVAHSRVAMAVGYAAVGAPTLLSAAELDAVRSPSLPSRAEIAERAIADRDPHVIKLANVALVEESRTTDPLYRFAAARVVGLVPAARALLH